jgi:hypothetical protein
VFENALILDESGLDCSKENTYTFPVESRINSLTVIARGNAVSQNIKLTDESGNDLNPQVKVSDQGSYIATVGKSAGFLQNIFFHFQSDPVLVETEK